MKKMVNRITVEGIHYDNELKKSEKGYVNGKLSILVSNDDAEVKNICDMRVIAGAKYGNSPDAKANPNFDKYCELMDGKSQNSFMGGGVPIGVSISGAFEPNYMLRRGTEPTRENMTTSVRNGASFIDLMPASTISKPQAIFETDIAITSIIPEMSQGEFPAPTGNVIVKGYVFTYKKVAVEVTMIAKGNNGSELSAAEYFAGLATDYLGEEGAFVFTKVWGTINGFNTSVTTEEKSAFGESKIVSFTRTKRELEITGAMQTPYPDGLTKEELDKALQAREVEIAAALDRVTTARNNTGAPTTNTETLASAFGGFGGGGFGGKFQF